MPRFLLALDLWDPKRGGLEHYADQCARELSARGLPLEIVCGEARVPAPDGIPLRELSVSGPRFYEALDAVTREEPSSLVLSFRHPGSSAAVFLPLGGLFESTLAARRRFEPRILRSPKRLARALDPRTRCFLRRERDFFRQDGAEERLVLASSQLVAGELQRLHPKFPGRVTVTGLPVDEERFHIPSSQERDSALGTLPEAARGEFRMLWIGNDPKRKGLRATLAVHERLRARKLDVALLLAGHGTERFSRRQVHGLGHVDDPSVLYAAADLVIAPSLEDNLSFSVLEALASGVPVVTSSCNGAAEYLKDQRVGRVVQDPLDHSALDAAALHMLRQKAQSDEAKVLRRSSIASAFQSRHFDRLMDALAQAAP